MKLQVKSLQTATKQHTTSCVVQKSSKLPSKNYLIISRKKEGSDTNGFSEWITSQQIALAIGATIKQWARLENLRKRGLK